MVRGLVLAIAAMAGMIGAALPAGAQSVQPGTWIVRFQPTEMGGRLAACTLKFGGLAAEAVGGQTGFVLFNGSVHIQTVADTRSVVLTLGTSRVVRRDGRYTNEAARPQSAWLRGPSRRDSAAHVINAIPGEDKDDVFVVMRADQAMIALLRESVEAARLEVMYRREGGGTPLALTVELDVVDGDRTGALTRSRAHLEQFLACAARLWPK